MSDSDNDDFELLVLVHNALRAPYQFTAEQTTVIGAMDVAQRWVARRGQQYLVRFPDPHSVSERRRRFANVNQISDHYVAFYEKAGK